MEKQQLHPVEAHRRPLWRVRLAAVALVSVGLLLVQWAPLPRPVLHLTASLSSSKSLDFSDLHYSKQCPQLSFIGGDEFTERRDTLAGLLKDASGWAAYIAEAGPNTLYYANITADDWHASERPWLISISPSGPSQHHLSVLTPYFEKSRSQRLPFALSPAEFDKVSWVTWREAENPYQVLVDHLAELKKGDGVEGDWVVHVEENVRTFVFDGMREAAEVKGGVEVQFAALSVREQRMKKTNIEFGLQHCAAKVTLAALRAVRKQLYLGMTEKDGEAMILKALTAAGLKDLEAIVLFGENAALPHATASHSKTLHKGEFALFDVGGSIGGYNSDFTRTMLPDSPSSCHGARLQAWPDARAEKIWKTVHAAQEAALAALVKNETEMVWAANVDKAAREVIEEAGFGISFTHRVGHGIGLQVHEHPYLNSGNFQPLQPGETFSNEPGIYIEAEADQDGNGVGVRLEDMVLKTATGWELVSGSTLAVSPWEP
ncbi:hypothetical protein MNV49_002856 [Pseudohyphozyma bogoriensis]|nr:hypothetical protein MNV49_002856 [Pseudohyphozyma bogoriensis]